MKSTKIDLKKIITKIQKEKIRKRKRKGKQNTVDYYGNPQCNGYWVNNRFPHIF
jgi:hypothetical protein